MSETLRMKRIVIATSLSEASDGTVRTGVAVAEATGAVPWLVHGYSLQAFPSELVAMDTRWIEEQQEALREQLARQAQRTGLSGLPGFGPENLHLAAEPPSRTIVDLARRLQADLIVIGATESGALRRALLGSTADGVIRQATCPVLVVRSPAAFPPARVEIPVDLSPISAYALRLGKDFLARLGAETAETEVLLVLGSFEVASMLHFTADQVEAFALEELRRFMAANGARGDRAQVRTGYPPDEILAVLEKQPADLAILGTHGRRGFDRFLLGSVASGVMHRAACNLLVVPPGAALQQEEAAREHREQVFGGDWQFVSDETPAAAGRI